MCFIFHQATAAVFKAQPVREVAAPGLLYIGQREYAIIGPGDSKFW